MVAISLYRGNMHRVSQDIPRRWLMPTPRISLKDFRTLLHRRSKALSQLPSSSSNPNPNSFLLQESSVKKEKELTEPQNPNPFPEPPKLADVNVDSVAVKAEDLVDSDVKLEAVTSALDQVASLLEDDVKEKEKENEKGKEKEKEKEEEKKREEEKVSVDGENLALEGDNKLDANDEKEKRKREVEEKLQILNEKKHNLVQALKQILNAEEELKRRSNMQAGRPPVPLQVDASNDSGSMTRHATPRTGSEANANADMEGGEGDDTLNHNPQSRQLLRMSSTSPSAESALRKPPYFQHNVVSHPSRAAVVAAGSPRFAPSGNQGHPSNLLTVSVSGTNYNASSPSPAASGGTSGFKDACQPSPWN